MSTLPSPTMSTSMYEVFHWGHTAPTTVSDSSGGGAGNGSTGWSSTPFRTGKRMQFSIAGPQINIDDEPPQPRPVTSINRSSTTENFFAATKGGSNTFQRGSGGGGGGIGSVMPANGERKSAVRIAFAQFAGVVRSYCYYQLCGSST